MASRAGAEEHAVLLSSHLPGGESLEWEQVDLGGRPLRVCLMAPPSPNVCGQFLAANLSVLSGWPRWPRDPTDRGTRTDTSEAHLSAPVSCTWATDLGGFRALRTCLHGKGVSVPGLLWPCSSERGRGLPHGGPAGEPAGLAGGPGTVPRAPPRERPRSPLYCPFHQSRQQAVTSSQHFCSPFSGCR